MNRICTLGTGYMCTIVVMFTDSIIEVLDFGSIDEEENTGNEFVQTNKQSWNVHVFEEDTLSNIYGYNFNSEKDGSFFHRVATTK